MFHVSLGGLEGSIRAAVLVWHFHEADRRFYKILPGIKKHFKKANTLLFV